MKATIRPAITFLAISSMEISVVHVRGLLDSCGQLTVVHLLSPYWGWDRSRLPAPYACRSSSWSCPDVATRSSQRFDQSPRLSRHPRHAGLDRERTWSDDTTHAIHEDQTLRIERVHEAGPRDTAWTVAAYETPVSERMWHLTATGTAPEPVLQSLLTHLADGDASDTALGSPITDKTVTPNPSRTPVGRIPSTDAGSGGRIPPRTPEYSSTPSPPRTPTAPRHLDHLGRHRRQQHHLGHPGLRLHPGRSPR
ncbi:DUF317 domain-containing protein [Streptomyces sp. NPDC001833]|uniref:DUF317 domain-containing protein n=1 Tax=Streptomyces sp. NPDC001833 TaxID=3154658 RepID=UPI00331FB09F